MGELLGLLAGFVIVILVIALIVYIAQAIFLNKFNKLVFGKGTPMAWIPIANIYLLGKLTFNKIVGWILVICSFSGVNITTTINGVETTRPLLPENVSSIVSPIYSIAIIVLFIYAIIKYFKIKNDCKNKTISTTEGSINIENNINIQQPTQPTMQQPVVNTISVETTIPTEVTQPQQVVEVPGVIQNQPQPVNQTSIPQNPNPLETLQNNLNQQPTINNSTYCAYCGTKLNDNIDTCPHCGNKVIK